MKRIFVAVVCLFALGVSCAMAENAKIPNPIKDAKVGDWVLYKIASMGGTQKQTVVKVDDKEVTVKVEMTMGENKLPATEIKIPKDAMEKGQKEKAEQIKTTVEKIKVNGKEIECVVAEIEQKGQKVKTWFSKDIPLIGIVKTESSGQVIMEITDWGKK